MTEGIDDMVVLSISRSIGGGCALWDVVDDW
jgi:hypothetical protein